MEDPSQSVDQLSIVKFVANLCKTVEIYLTNIAVQTFIAKRIDVIDNIAINIARWETLQYLCPKTKILQ